MVNFMDKTDTPEHRSICIVDPPQLIGLSEDNNFQDRIDTIFTSPFIGHNALHSNTSGGSYPLINRNDDDWSLYYNYHSSTFDDNEPILLPRPSAIVTPDSEFWNDSVVHLRDETLA